MSDNAEDQKESLYEKKALELIQDGNPIDQLRLWWCHYYKRPFLDPLFEKYTIEQLYIEFYATQFLDNPKTIEEREKIEKAKEKGVYKDEEDWFKEQMGADYTTEEATIDEPEIKHNENIKNKVKLNSKIKEEDLPEDIDIKF